MTDLPDIAKTEAAIVARTNEFRKSQGLGPVRRNAQLDRAARSFARHLAETGRFAHEADGRTPAARAGAAGYAFCNMAENLALDRDSRGFTVEKLSRDTVEGWKASPGHRRNLMQPGVTEVGVGVAQAPAGPPKFLSVQMLGRPRSMAFQFSVTNKTTSKVSYVFAGKTHEVAPRMVVTYTTCEPGRLTFQSAGNWLFGQKITKEYNITGKAAFELRTGRDGRIEVSERK